MDSLKLLFTFALIALAPSLLVMMTSFTRIIIVFSFLRNALGLQQTPPNQVLIGLALFLSLFIMYPVITEMNDTAVKPFSSGEITQEVAIDRVQEPLKVFMLKHTRKKDLSLFLSIAKAPAPKTKADVPLEVLVPAFLISELKTAFEIGFLIFLPFLIVDMVVAAVLLSMGMMMLPPVTISLPFKVLLFVLVDGWYLIVGSLVRGYTG